MRKSFYIAPVDIEFWNLVKDISWKKGSNTDYRKIRIDLTFRYKNNREFIFRMKSTLMDYHLELTDFLTEYYFMSNENVLFGIGRDSGSDLINEIIGRGRSFYNKVLKDPMIAARMYKDGDYKESFRYCFPSDRDFIDINMGENILYPTSVTMQLGGTTPEKEEEI